MASLSNLHLKGASAKYTEQSTGLESTIDINDTKDKPLEIKIEHRCIIVAGHTMCYACHHDSQHSGQLKD